jgi:RND family efflux transporter MFP subunit
MTQSSSVFAATHHLRRRSHIFVLPLVAAVALPAGAQEQKTGTGEFDCLIAPKMVLKLGTPVPGLLSHVLVDRGAIVKKGDVLAKLESGVEEAAIALAQARADNDSTVKSARARRDFQLRKEERAKQLRRTENIPLSAADEAETAARVAESEYEEARVNLQLARLDLARAAEVLKQRTIRSPIDGVVVERKLGPGEYAFDQAHLLTVSQIDPLNVEVYVPLTQFGRIHLGASAQVYPEVGGEYPATVTVVDQVFDAASGTIGIRLELPNPDYAIPAGLKCQVRFAGLG